MAELYIRNTSQKACKSAEYSLDWICEGEHKFNQSAKIWGRAIMRLATVLFGATCAVATVQLACAADLSSRVAPLPVMPVAYNWAGFYVGANGGYAWATTDTSATNLGNGSFDGTNSHNLNGGFGGGQIGYNFFPFPHFLLGFEGDGDWADLTNNTTTCRDASNCSNSDGKDNWFSTARVRMGYVLDDWLFYGTGGFAWVGTQNTRTIVVAPANLSVLVGQAASLSATRTGWTLGGGVEYGFWRNWSVNVEYRYMQFNYNDNYLYSLPIAARQIGAQQSVNTVRVGLNYHFN